ncbi:hypothetical protein L1I30_05120 [Gillisia sp. M10.2A]|uniref:HNH endonuclease n=1 Tax=Gillisia lutea TaxID=2909668 RepID=A0ABS9EDW1_9FLAO|nr:hypothetical protein [Gillisia lutea]MCF4101036.1 hypothetical protein [Gillisia lutea]
MLFIDPDDSKIIRAKDRFLENLKPKILDNIENKVQYHYCKLFFNQNIIPYIDDILIGTPEKLHNLAKEHSNFINESPLLKRLVEQVFNYDWFIKKETKPYGAYELALDLGINTCVYCNRNYTNTVIDDKGKKVIRPQFDHFIDKGNNPLFRLSFFNLIPCCSTCNSNLKGSTPFSMETHLHPYNDKILKEFNFSYEYSAKEDELEVLIKPDTLPPRIKESFNEFKILDIYNAHTSEVKDLIRLKEAFSDNYLSILSSSVLNDIKISQREMYRIVFGTYYEDDKLHLRPFGKLKRDLLQELKITT